MAVITTAHTPTDVVPYPFPPGRQPDRWVPGDLRLTHSPDGYGWMQIGSLTLTLLTGSRLSIGVDGTEVCSAFAGKSLRPAGYWWERRGRVVDETFLTPADLAVSFHTERIRESVLAAGAGDTATRQPTDREDEAG